MNPAPAHLVDALQGRYAVGAPLGAGGMAAVYRARDEKHGREVALKVLRPEVSETLGRQRFLSESCAAAGAHDRAVELLDRAVTMAFWTAEYYQRFCPFFKGLRDRADLQAAVARAAERAAAFQV